MSSGAWSKEIAPPVTAEPTTIAPPPQPVAAVVPAIIEREPRLPPLLREAPPSRDYMEGYKDARAFKDVRDDFNQSYAEGYAFGIIARNAQADNANHAMLMEGDWDCYRQPMGIRTDISEATKIAMLDDFKAVREADIASTQGGLLLDV